MPCDRRAMNNSDFPSSQNSQSAENDKRDGNSSEERRDSQPTVSPQVHNEIRQAIRHVTAEFSGPLPPPDILRQYEDVSEGLSERLISLVEKEADFRRKMEERYLEAQIEFKSRSLEISSLEVKRGQVFGLTIGCVALVCGLITAWIGHPVAGTLLGSGTILGLVSAFLYGRKTPHKVDWNEESGAEMAEFSRDESEGKETDCS